jgi:hypothetical protein
MKASESIRVPFREVLDSQAFWWRGECYVKENAEFIFLHEPIPVPFGPDEMVEVSLEK